MDDALQLTLPLAGVEQVACALDMCRAVEFSGHTGVVEAARQVIDDGGTVNRPLHLLRVGDVSRNDGYCFTALLACLLLVAYEYAHWLLLFQQFGHQCGTEKTCCTCYDYGHWRAPE